MLQALLEAHDAVAARRFLPELPDIAHEVDEDEESVKVVRLVKGSKEPLVRGWGGRGGWCRRVGVRAWAGRGERMGPHGTTGRAKGSVMGSKEPLVRRWGRSGCGWAGWVGMKGRGGHGGMGRMSSVVEKCQVSWVAWAMRGGWA